MSPGRLLAICLPALWATAAHADPVDAVGDPLTIGTDGIWQGPAALCLEPGRLSRDLTPQVGAGVGFDRDGPGVSALGAMRRGNLSGVLLLGLDGAASSATDEADDQALLFNNRESSTDRRLHFGLGAALKAGDKMGIGLSLRLSQRDAWQSLAHTDGEFIPGSNEDESALIGPEEDPTGTRDTRTEGGIRGASTDFALTAGLATLTGKRRGHASIEHRWQRSLETVDAFYIDETTTPDGTEAETDTLLGLSPFNQFGMSNLSFESTNFSGGLDLGGSPTDPDWRIEGAFGLGKISAPEDQLDHEVEDRQGRLTGEAWRADTAEGKLQAVSLGAFRRIGAEDAGSLRVGLALAWTHAGLSLELSEESAEPDDTDTTSSSDGPPPPSAAVSTSTWAGELALDPSQVGEADLGFSQLSLRLPVGAMLPLGDHLRALGAVTAELRRESGWMEDPDGARSTSENLEISLDARAGFAWQTQSGVALQLLWAPVEGTGEVDLTKAAAWLTWTAAERERRRKHKR